MIGVGFRLLTGLLLAVNFPALGCSIFVDPEEMEPTTFELVQIAPVIVVATANEPIGNAANSGVRLHVREVLKGNIAQSFEISSAPFATPDDANRFGGSDYPYPPGP